MQWCVPNKHTWPLNPTPVTSTPHLAPQPHTCREFETEPVKPVCQPKRHLQGFPVYPAGLPSGHLGRIRGCTLITPCHCTLCGQQAEEWRGGQWRGWASAAQYGKGEGGGRHHRMV